MDFPPSLTPRSTKKASRNSDNNRRKENRSNKDDTPPQRRRNNDGSRGRNASGTARSNEVIVIDDGDDSDDNIKAAKKKSADDERKPAAKVSATVTSPKKQHQPRCISLLDEDDDSSVEEIQTNNMEVEAGRKRSRSNKVSMMVMNNVDSDRALAEKLQKKEEDAAARNSNNIAKANPLREQRLMARSTDGKAVLAVQEIMALVTETRNIAKKYKNYQLVNYIAAVTREDMFHFAKSMLELQQEFPRQKINGYIDVGYHYTDSRHMANIRQHGQLTKKDRDSQKVNSTLHGSVFGDGVYTANNPDNFSNYGNTGVLVARLTGNMVRVARSLHPNTKVDANTIVGDKMMTAMPMPSMPAMSGHHRQGQSLDKDGWPLNDDYHEIVLRSSAQCLPMISYDSRARQTKEGKECIENMEKGLQAIFDKLFNKGMKRSAYKDSEILKAPTASYNHPLPAFNGLNMGLPPASSSAILPPGFPAPLPGMPVPGMGPSIASGTFGRGSTTTTRSSLSMARQRMIGNVPSTTGGNNPLSSNATSSASNTLTYKAPTTLTTGIPSDAMSTPESSCNMEEDCVICQDPLHRRRKGAKLKCQHIFHKDCIQRAFQSKPECPTCRKSIGAPAGKCPSGTMTTTTSSMRCSGFREGSIVITYVIPAGRQMSYHDNPGTSHASKHVAAYIPNNTDGQALLKRLKYAFLHGLTFNVGTSLTTGQKNQCTWASIHHKTSPTGGVQAHGFPDPDYFKNCNAELDGLGVSPAHSLGEDGKEV